VRQLLYGQRDTPIVIEAKVASPGL
jgi:hypothetical protein